MGSRSAPTSFAAEDAAPFQAFLDSHPHVLALFAGTRCPYSATLRPHFEGAAARETPAGRAFAVRALDETKDAGWDERGVRVTPTVVAYAWGSEVARLEGRLLLGITRQALGRWLRTLPPA